MELDTQWSALAELLSTPGSPAASVDAGLRAVRDAAVKATSAQRRKVGARMIEAVRTMPARAAGLAALCGGMIAELENGLPGLGDAIAERLAAVFADALAEKQLVAVGSWTMPLVGALCREPALRRRLHGDAALRDVIARVADAHELALSLLRLVRAPCDERFRFVDEPSGRAFELEVDGVPLAYELHTWFADTVGPTLGLAPETGALRHQRWDLFTWTGEWFWGEMLPDEAPPLDDVRTIVARPLTIARTWEQKPIFPLLRARVALVRELDAAEASTLAARIAPRRS